MHESLNVVAQGSLGVAGWGWPDCARLRGFNSRLRTRTCSSTRPKVQPVGLHAPTSIPLLPE
eukprot:10862821-Alexandrium_andersonii.AAC.1